MLIICLQNDLFCRRYSMLAPRSSRHHISNCVIFFRFTLQLAKCCLEKFVDSAEISTESKGLSSEHQKESLSVTYRNQNCTTQSLHSMKNVTLETAGLSQEENAPREVGYIFLYAWCFYILYFVLLDVFCFSKQQLVCVSVTPLTSFRVFL